MKELHTRFNKSSILTSDQKTTIKGGKRLQSRFSGRLSMMSMSSSSTSTSSGGTTVTSGYIHSNMSGNEYCLEW